ncbi:OLC1v1019949C1 [Oldenlandia corymbosa var. corymbosa]|uniref:chlorophyllase n=1 Tax=Oldenlandia corymbosa var. corymbosa TaxID=529605 RepID=A0AAV1EFC8_OLDCO|nr:OLC1v1019949C1 [Oldenlandia corymbosa var. corymbosa]
MASCNNTSSVFENGDYKTKLIKVEQEKLCGAGNCGSSSSSSSSSSSPPPPPPKPLLIGTPIQAGEYPVLLFLHGYLLSNSFYSQLVQHIASHGFIVVAPQLYLVTGCDATEEIKSAAAITNWFPEGLQDCLPPNVRPNLSKLALSGHSRGGKEAFALALGRVIPKPPLKFSALIGVDPVDGMDKGKQTPPPVLTYIPHSFDLEMPVLVLGSGLGEIKRNPLYPPCAPKGVNHGDFFNECEKPAYYFVVKDYGHVDMLDDDTKGIRGKATYCFCKNGKSREPMRRFVGGVMVAFLRAYLEDDSEDLEAIRTGEAVLPVVIQKQDFLL